jgi:hypothetical protein
MASMGQSEVGYSGSIENLNMDPVGAQILPEKGTNGQTIHHLIAQKTEVSLVDCGVDALFADLIDSHPDRPYMRAIIDAGAHFLGSDNEEVATAICRRMSSYGSDV